MTLTTPEGMTLIFVWNCLLWGSWISACQNFLTSLSAPSLKMRRKKGRVGHSQQSISSFLVPVCELVLKPCLMSYAPKHIAEGIRHYRRLLRWYTGTHLMKTWSFFHLRLTYTKLPMDLITITITILQIHHWTWAIFFLFPQVEYWWHELRTSWVGWYIG